MDCKGMRKMWEIGCKTHLRLSSCGLYRHTFPLFRQCEQEGVNPLHLLDISDDSGEGAGARVRPRPVYLNFALPTSNTGCRDMPSGNILLRGCRRRRLHVGRYLKTGPSGVGQDDNRGLSPVKGAIATNYETPILIFPSVHPVASRYEV